MTEVIPLRLAEITIPAGRPAEGTTLPVLGFVVRHRDGIFLFETGVGEGHAEVERLFRPRRRPIPAALAEVGIDIDEVSVVANSHLHFDHSGNNPLFAGRTIHVQASERAAAQAPDYTVPEWVEFPGARYREHEGDRRIAPGVTLLSTPGHSPGHQSVRIDTPDGVVLLVGQALLSLEEWTAGSGGRSGADDAGDREAYDASVARLRALDPVRVHFSHDERVWERSG